MSADEPVAAAPPPKKRRSIFLSILLLLVVAVAALAGVIAMRPDDYRVSRSIVVSTPAQAPFDEVNDFHRWESWSPWAKLDPEAKNTFSGPDSGNGAGFAWSGNDKVGEGSMLILDSKPYEHVQIKLDFKRPMEDTSTIDFVFEPTGEQTKIVWTMSGTYPNFLGKAMCFFMNMDKMVGGDFERGLESLKRVVETKAPEGDGDAT